jgi:hypothetical protein
MCPFPESRADRPAPAVVRVAACALLALAAMVTGAAAQTETVRLLAVPFDKAIVTPDGATVTVPMWGFAIDSVGDGTLNGAEAP